MYKINDKNWHNLLMRGQRILENWANH